MRSKQLFITSLVAVAIFILSGRSSAQYRDSLGVPFNNPISASISTMIWGNINRAAIQGAQKAHSSRNSSTSRRSTSSASTQRPATSSPSSQVEIVPAYRTYPAVRFKPTGTRLILNEYLASVNVSAAQKEELKALVLAIWEVYEEEAAKRGLSSDVALALVSYIGLNAHVYAGKTGKLSLPFEQNVGLRDLVAEQTTDNGTFKNSTDRQKQELYELFVMMGGLTYHYYDKAVKANNVDEIRETRLIAEQNLKRLGIEP